ncbi:hypothetical protein LI328DRAFT_127078 [Trichoderma asperelloides]|nr:hypothetical protein LI328DRAFT_127078 [Trichoderma asperelloides]
MLLLSVLLLLVAFDTIMGQVEKCLELRVVSRRFSAPLSRRYYQWLSSSIDCKNGAYHPQGGRGTKIRHRKRGYQRAANGYQ